MEQSVICSYLGMPAVIASEPMRKLMRFVEKIAQTNAAVLITGESGSGKEMIARAVHQSSPRSAKPWVDVNCAALPDHLIESELFGYEKGAFSGADTAKPGMFELANHGTLFLDEIAELNLKSQSKLLRVLDGWPHYRLGGTRKVEINVRIVAATNADLEKDVQAGKFRADLFHRLNQVRVAVPSLRERTADIAPLARLFLSQEKESLRISPEAVVTLERYLWPGNIRELRSLMALLAVMTTGDEVKLEDLPPAIQPANHELAAAPSYSLNKLEEEVIFDALAQAAGRRDRAAELLGISTRTLMRRLKGYGAKSPRAADCTEVQCN
jgi:transcriptional regulator with PAS, ATPase and Fis domain